MTDCYIKAEILSGILDRRLFSDTARVSVKTDNGTKCIFYVNESEIKTEQQIKAEAIKEFAERVRNYIKTKCNPYGKPTLDYETSIAIMHYIDNLVKELTEEKNDE